MDMATDDGKDRAGVAVTVVEHHCPYCGRLLFESCNLSGKIFIRCRKCGKYATFSGVHITNTQVDMHNKITYTE
jgi:uncharacterized Zn finger protein (UPF0148 family)